MNETNQARYSAGAMILHWLLAIGVIVNWQLAEAAHEGPREAGASLMATHKAIGMTILALTVIRIVWRLMHKPPPLNPQHAAWENALARITHAVFYILLITLPLLGWIASSSFAKGVDIFGLFTVPPLPVSEAPKTGETLFDIHHTLGSVMIYLMFLHILGALKHTFWDKDGNLWRMLPFGTPKG